MTSCNVRMLEWIFLFNNVHKKNNAKRLEVGESNSGKTRFTGNKRRKVLDLIIHALQD